MPRLGGIACSTSWVVPSPPIAMMASKLSGATRCTSSAQQQRRRTARVVGCRCAAREMAGTQQLWQGAQHASLYRALQPRHMPPQRNSAARLDRCSALVLRYPRRTQPSPGHGGGDTCGMVPSLREVHLQLAARRLKHRPHLLLVNRWRPAHNVSQQAEGDKNQWNGGGQQVAAGLLCIVRCGLGNRQTKGAGHARATRLAAFHRIKDLSRQCYPTRVLTLTHFPGPLAGFTITSRRDGRSVPRQQHVARSMRAACSAAS